MKTDYIYPDWDKGGKVHNWKNYVSDELKALWEEFSEKQRIVLGENFDSIASDEEWE